MLTLINAHKSQKSTIFQDIYIKIISSGNNLHLKQFFNFLMGVKLNNWGISVTSIQNTGGRKFLATIKINIGGRHLELV